MRIEDLRKSFENLDFSVRLSSWGKEDMYDFILSALTIMSLWTESKLNYFWKNGEEESALEGWIDCLEVITANAVIATLESVRDGHYKKYEDLIPRSAIDFKHFALSGNHRKSPPEPSSLLKLNSNSDEDKVPSQRKRSEQIARENLAKIRDLLKTSFRKLEKEHI